jgi:hypothetical protein
MFTVHFSVSVKKEQVMENLDGGVRNLIFYGKVHFLTPGSVSSLNTVFACTEDIHFNNNDF